MKNLGSLKRICSNNYFMIKLLFKASPFYAITLIIEAIRHEFFVFFEHTYGIGFILEAVEFGKSFQEVLYFLVFLMIIIACSAVYTNYFQHYIAVKHIPVVQQELKMQLFEKAKELDLACYDDPAYYNDFVLAVSESEKSIERTTRFLQMLFAGITIFLCYGIFFISKDAVSVLFVFASFLLRFFFMRLANKLRFQIRMKENPLERKRSYIHRVFYLNEYAKELRMNKESLKDFYKDFENVNGELYELHRSMGRKKFTLEFITHYLCNDFILDVFYIAYLVFSAAVLHKISYSSVVILYTSTGNFKRGFANLTDIFPFAMETSLYVEKIRAFLSYETKITSEKQLPVSKEPKRLQLHNVSFAYQENGEQIISNLNKTIEPYEKIALVGYNGAGKTTLTKLLMRLYDPSEGKITLDDIDIKDYDIKAYRNGVSAVFQDYRLYATSVEGNVVMDELQYGNQDKVLNSLEQSGFMERLSSLKSGINTPLTTEFEEDGVDLSGGESQKLAIARAFYKDAGLIILDEPSSALDPIAEYYLNQSMFKAAKNKTVIFISHRLSTTRKADRIFMLEKGQIIEAGTHKELLQSNGKYASMWRAQAGKYAD